MKAQIVPVHPVTRPIVSDKGFLAPECTSQYIDLYTYRKAILRVLSPRLAASEGTLLDIGCGDMPYRPLVSSASRVKTYIGLDLKGSGYSRPDLYWNGRHIPLKTGSVDCAIAIEVLEHCTSPQLVLREAIRVLKPGGAFFCTTPFLWPLHSVPHDEFRYTPFSISRLLGRVGFEQINVNALGGWDASLAQMIGLWVRRRPMAERKRSVLSSLAVPVVRYLLSHDRADTPFTESSMVTGLFASAVKPA